MREPKSVTEATAEYKVESDQIGQWIGERVELESEYVAKDGTSKPVYSANITALYRDFVAWLEENRSDRYAISQKSFAVMLGERPGITKTKATSGPDKGKMIYSGLLLRPLPPCVASQR